MRLAVPRYSKSRMSSLNQYQVLDQQYRIIKLLQKMSVHWHYFFQQSKLDKKVEMANQDGLFGLCFSCLFYFSGKHTHGAVRAFDTSLGIQVPLCQDFLVTWCYTYSKRRLLSSKHALLLLFSSTIFSWLQLGVLDAPIDQQRHSGKAEEKQGNSSKSSR